MSTENTSLPELVAPVVKIRLALAVCLGSAALFALTGIPEHVVFARPSVIKYVATVAAPAAALIMVSLEDAKKAAICVLIVAAPFNYIITAFGVHLSLLYVGIAVVFFAVWLTDEGGKRSWLAVSSLAFGVITGLAILRGTNSVRSLLLLASGLTVGAMVSKLARSDERRLTIVCALLASGCIQASLAVYQYITGRTLNIYGQAGGGSYSASYFFGFAGIERSSGSFPDPISFGNFLAVTLPLVVYAVWRTHRAVYRAVFVLAGVIMVLGLAVSLSRASWIAACIGTAFAIVLLPKRRRARTMLLAGLMLALSIVLVFSFARAVIVQRFDSISDPTSPQVYNSQSDVVRLEFQHVALQVAQRHPVFGVGVGNLSPYLVRAVPGTGVAAHAHNLYLEFFAEAGVIGLLALAVLLASFVIVLSRVRQVDPLVVAGLFGSFVAMLICWLTDFTAQVPPVLFAISIIFGLAASANRNVQGGQFVSQRG